jgi:hypothetical protein
MQRGFASKVTTYLESDLFWFVLVRVTSWIVFVSLDKKNDPRRATKQGQGNSDN